jgi:signal transduction histidine kinase/ActR/RegA family two-component response regulator
MHSHLRTFQETGVATSLSGAFAQSVASNTLPIAAELWVERCLSHFSSRLNESLNAALSQPSLTEPISASYSQGIAAHLLQLLVDHLSQALVDEIVAIVDPVLSSEGDQTPLFEIRHQAKLPYRMDSEPSMERSIAQTTLRQWQSQAQQSAWPMGDSSTSGWLIVIALSQTSQSHQAVAYLQLRSTLVKRSIAQTLQVISQVQQVQQLQQHRHQLQIQTQELTQTNRLKSEFLANTSHEIRTPLSSILGFTHLLREQGYNPGNPRHQEYLRIILSSGQHLLALINDILDLSKIEANQLDLHCETVDVLSVCQMALKLVKEKANDRGLTLKLDVADGVGTIVVDPLRLKQMLFNLLSNALKFTIRGTVGLEVQLVENQLNFTVWDTGTGISEEQQQLLFRPYTQLTNAVEGEGTGLGLALTQKLAELHGGQVTVESQLRLGSRFTIVLPLTRNEEAGELLQPSAIVPQVKASTQPALKTQSAPTFQSPLPVHDKPSVMRAYHILLVEDNVHNARLLITYLCRLGYEVTWAKDSRAMWQSLTQSLPALILMDIHLLGADGLDLTQQLQADANYRSIPVIVQTAMAMKGDRERCLASGAVDYISKPIDLKILANMVAKYSGLGSGEPGTTDAENKV